MNGVGRREGVVQGSLAPEVSPRPPSGWGIQAIWGQRQEGPVHSPRPGGGNAGVLTQSPSPRAEEAKCRTADRDGEGETETDRQKETHREGERQT